MENVIEGLFPLAVDIDTVKEDPKNARKHPACNLKALKESLGTYGQREPIVANSETGIIEAGNGMWRTARPWSGSGSRPSWSKTTQNRCSV